MKTCIIVTLLTFLAVCTLPAAAQKKDVLLNEPNYNKPKRFANLPDKLPLHVTEMVNLLRLPIGAKVNASIAKDLVLYGIVVSKSNPADKAVQSVVIKSLNRSGTAFTFTRLTEADGSVSYMGRMIDRTAGDALEIAQEGQEYVIRKKGVNEIISE